MSDSPPDRPELNPSALSGAEFTRVRRGFEPAEVHAALGHAADVLRTWQARDDALLARIEDLTQELAAAHELDEDRITEVLGSETARIVAAAREAAAEIRTNAETRAATLIADSESQATTRADALIADATAQRDSATKERDEAREEASLLRQQAIDETSARRAETEAAVEAMRTEAESEANRVRSEAEATASALEAAANARHDELVSQAASVLAERTGEAETAAAAIREVAEAERASARSDGERIRAEAEQAATAIIDRARDEGRQMLAEARQVRERMLRDLAERRKVSRQKFEAAQAGRRQIVEALQAAGASVAATIGELADLDRDVQRSMDAAVLSVSDDVDVVVSELQSALIAGDSDAEVADGAPSAEDAATSAGPTEDTSSSSPVESAEPESPETIEPGIGSASAENQPEETGPQDTGSENTGSEDSEPQDAEPEGAEIESGPSETAASDTAAVDEQSGATVHDLFTRLRADVGADDVEKVEATTESPADEGPTGAATSTVGEDEGDEPDPERSALDLRDHLLAPAERSLGRVLKRLVSDEQNEVLDRLRRSPKKQRPTLDSLLPEGADLEHFTESLRPEFALAVAAGTDFWRQRAGHSSAPLTSDDAGIDEALARQVGELLELRRARLQRTFDDAEAQDLDLAELGDRMRTAYRDWRSSAVAERAGDLATAGFAEGTRQAAGPNASWSWVVDNGGLPCSDAEDNSLAGAVACGDKFPTGDVVPPAHPGCRCILVPAAQ